MSGSLAVLLLATALGCRTGPEAPVDLVSGTWGGTDAGLIAADSSVHVHIGCTLGDAHGPIHPDASGHFEATGTYNVDAFPVDRGVLHPARFFGTTSGNTLTLTVQLTDTTRTLGPVVLTFGKEPGMTVCPICRTPQSRRGT